MTFKVYAYPGDAWGCGAYRVKWPAEAVGKLTGWDVTVVSPEERAVAVQVDGDRVLAENFPADADLVVMQRLTNAFMYQVVGMLRARGVAVVVDMDDDLSCIDPRNPAFFGMAPTQRMAMRDRFTGETVIAQRKNHHSFHNAARACRDATLVTVTTPQLAKSYGAHGRVVVLPNQVPAWYLDVPREDSDLIGWGGSVHSHPDDLQQVGPAIARLVQRGFRFETVGDPAGVGRALGLREDPPSPGPVDLTEWPRALARFGVGIAPLAPTRFNDAKSRLKPLEYASVGVVPVASPAADYQAFAGLGGCLLARKPRSWEAQLRDLARDDGRRAELSEAVRAVAADHTIEGNAERWAEAWAAAIDIERARVPAGAT